MSTWKLGDVSVERMGFGAMRITAHPDRAIAVLRRAVELGVNHLDTAAFYGSGKRFASELIREALAPYPADLVIATKVGPGSDPERGFYNATTAAELREQVETNLRQLGVDCLDVVNLRITGEGSLGERFGWLVEFRDEGLIKQLGVSNVRLDHVEEALAIAPIVCVQNSYAVDRRGDEDAIIRFCAERDIAYVPFGAITDAHDSAAVDALAAAHNATPQQVRLAWTLHHSPNILAIPGTGSVAHLEENIAAGSLHFSPEELATLD
ncbi:aldo/keto reductase [Kribbella sindirgiensis]|uniref:Aldo/keto reductase n=1 Tax=Kribbella sindirgiensis TaxID=1124744 RepID=A0A4R0J6W8_9ACTN|nr:aldo/keto reductase [Kribbella sindirgiensis]TCC37105.1 aldo/keto reductase [Kribbella sindirgiensis]